MARKQLILKMTEDVAGVVDVVRVGPTRQHRSMMFYDWMALFLHDPAV
jgi:hypothetical protein